MGKQKQQRRSAKKKGGKKGEAKTGAGQNIREGDESVKCTACAQLVKPEDAVPCPVFECDRIFCTERCSASCLVQCADPLCPSPNRCRPCASGKTLAILSRRNKFLQPESQMQITNMHRGYATCDVCPNKVCSECSYFGACSKCHKRVCIDCIGSDRCILNYCGGACNAVYCKQCDEGFDVYTKRCTECAVEAQFLAEGDEWPKNDPSEVTMCSDECKKIVDEVVLQYAEDVKQAMSGIALLSTLTQNEDARRLRSVFVSSEGGGVVAMTRETMKLVARIVRPSRKVSETIPQRVGRIFNMLTDKDGQLRKEGDEESLQLALSKNDRDFSVDSAVSRHKQRLRQLSIERLDLSLGISLALGPDAAAILGAFHIMEEQVFDITTTLKLQGIHLDVMQDLYQKELCGHCLRPTPNGDSTKRCGGCSAIRYCSRTCQALSWPVHRHHCRCMSMARRGYNERLLKKRFRDWPGTDADATRLDSLLAGWPERQAEQLEATMARPEN